MFSQSEWRGKCPIFLLEITWNGYIHRFATKRISLSDSTLEHSFERIMEQPPIELRLKKNSYGLSDDSIPFALDFSMDIAEQFANGNPLDGATGELFIVLENRRGEITGDYKTKERIFRGYVIQPVYGHPDRSPGYVEFSLEDRITPISLLDTVCGKNSHVDQADLSNEDKASSSPLSLVQSGTLIDVDEANKGKRIPIVLGNPGKVPGRTQFNESEIPYTPAYSIAYSNDVPSGQPMFIVLAGHDVMSDEVTIYDSEGNSLASSSFGNWVGRDLNTYTYCTVDFVPLPDLKSNVIDNQIQYFAAWNDGGGLPDPYGEGVLENGAHICAWALSMIDVEIDYDRWLSAAPRLKRYKFAGFINDPTVTPLDFLESEIIPFLPINLFMGEKGIYPILDLSVLGDDIEPNHEIEAGREFYRGSPIRTMEEPDRICNDFDFSYGYNMRSDSYRGSIRIDPQKNDLRWYSFTTDYATTSFRKYGIKTHTKESRFITDYKTAIQVSKDYIRRHSLPTREIEYFADPGYGYLNVGDILSLTDTEISLSNCRCQILRKSWKVSGWSFLLEFEDNRIINRGL